MQPWDNFGQKVDSRYRQVSSILENHPEFPWQKSNIAFSIKDQNGVLLCNEEDILDRRREHFKDLWNPVTIIPPDTQKIHLREDNIITAPEVFLAVKTT